MFEYLSISIILIVGISFYLLYHEYKNHFKASSPEVAQAKLGKQVTEGYHTLFNLVYHDCDKDSFQREIRQIAIQRADNRYIGGYSRVSNEFDADSFVLDYFYEFLNYLDAQHKNCIFTVDARLDLEAFDNQLRAVIPEVADEIEFPVLWDSEVKDLLLLYQKKLNEYKIQMSYLSDGSDSYYFLVHSLEKEKAVHNAIQKIGLKQIVLN